MVYRRPDVVTISAEVGNALGRTVSFVKETAVDVITLPKRILGRAKIGAGNTQIDRIRQKLREIKRSYEIGYNTGLTSGGGSANETPRRKGGYDLGDSVTF